jgi:hypothetical protein
LRKRKERKKDWLDEFRSLVAAKPIVVLRFDTDEWESINESRRGTTHFTVARSHASLEHVRSPTACLIFAEEFGGERHAYIALLTARSPVTTLDTRMTIERAHQISPRSEEALIELVTGKSLATNLRNRLKKADRVVPLSPVLSTHLVERLSEIDSNRGVMRSLVASLDVPRTYASNSALQEDAVSMVLRAFGISPHDPARSLTMVEGRETALARISIREDAVIEHDARSIPPFDLVGSDLTGRAVFEYGGERLEVITANKRPLEEVLGVDLIYLNAVKKNVVAVQYKMLESEGSDWIYRPDAQLRKEIERMKRFARARPAGPYEYRLNPQVFYLKFVRRDAQLGKSAITVPIDHYEILRTDPKCKGPKGAFLISYENLAGCYLRQEPFLDLIRSGYVGAHAETSADLQRLIDAVLKDDRAVVAAIHSAIER